MRVLLIEDDVHQAQFVRRGLTEAGHQVETSTDGRDGLFLAGSETFDMIVLDRMLPRVDGLTILRTLRASDIRTPIIVLSALAEVDERIEGLRAGGDDYLGKPFSIAELLARMEALQRRSAPPPGGEPTRLRVADLEMDLMRHSVARAGRPMALKPKEFKLLEYLMRHAGQVVSRTMLLEAVWDYHFDPGTNVIDVHISNLRGSLDIEGRPSLIQTVRGVGYRLEA
ncbi:response regulator transcription factor [Nitrogeniibacter mangrovi]|uniref:Response regulator transcription factor n=1 Tax=Nitrogeniibacter mangrovi TaxID=2016596 RepID=A0A6C1B4A5_9RHOO|nr:response regulator transcription factor [Nitrogeniibacter mangrovi]QID17829.1 response regulator transcription factor [Nitrogeniibacter mangrovi]